MFPSTERAADLFALLGETYQASVLRVHRLHILKRFTQYLAKSGGIESMAPASAYSTCRELLARAYTDFVNSSGIEQKVFKVFQTAQGRQAVPVGSIRRAATA